MTVPYADNYLPNGISKFPFYFVKLFGFTILSRRTLLALMTSIGAQEIWPVYIMSKVNWTWLFYTTSKPLHVTPDFWKLTITWLVFVIDSFEMLDAYMYCMIFYFIFL